MNNGVNEIEFHIMRQKESEKKADPTPAQVTKMINTSLARTATIGV